MAEQAKVYSMPFAIDIPSTTSTSDIKRHFTDSIQRDGDQLQASFRGRPLHGEILDVPSGYVGILYDSTTQENISSFRHLTYFNLDCTTSSNDCLARGMKWFSLAKLLHE